jgi:hypothetical protein
VTASQSGAYTGAMSPQRPTAHGESPLPHLPAGC